MKIIVELEFDENNLGPKWMNPDNLDLLLYGEHSTKKELLRVISYIEVASQQGTEADEENLWARLPSYKKI